MIKGGYKIIDFRDTEFETGGATMMLNGIYDSIEGNYRKPLLLAGLNIDGKEYNDTFAEVAVNESQFIFKVYGKVITITDTDAVSIAADA